METSLMVYDYPDPAEKETKIIKGKVYLIYKFETEVPKEWNEQDIINDIYENTNEYHQDLDDVEVNIMEVI